MPPTDHPIFLATRGSALALAQTNLVLSQCRAAFPHLTFEVRIIKTTGDKLQTAPPDLPGMPGTKGLFTKELELALLKGEADLAVHSLKDLPTELPDGLELCAVLPRADVRDALIYRDAQSWSSSGKRGLPAGAGVRDLPTGATVATSSTRRQAQLIETRPDLKIVPIRGNVGTRLQKLAAQAELDGLILAAAGLKRLDFQIDAEGRLGRPQGTKEKDKVPPGLRTTFLSVEAMIPCVGQGAIGIEGRMGDTRLAAVFARLNDAPTLSCVTAERAFLHAMGGGCLSPVAAYAEIIGEQIRIRAVSFREPAVRRSERIGTSADAANLGALVAADLQTA
jgi:hydroxymethylbilane synthase